MPAAIDGSVSDKRVRAWLARADLELCEAPREMLSRVVDAIDQPACEDGLAVLRFWGHTGDRPSVWMAAADPVHLEALLDRLRLHCLWPSEWHGQELRQLFDELQLMLADDDSAGFVPIGSYGYLRSDSAMPTALYSPELVNGCDPAEWLPTGPTAARYQTLLSEIQMTLHNSVVNQRREELDRRAINSLWIWGGGLAAEKVARDIPPLFADDPLLRGYWLSSDAEADAWPGSLDDCVARSPYGFVAVVPNQATSAEEYADTLTSYLRDLKQILKNSELRGLTLLFRQGLTAQVRPSQIFRVWRRDLPNLARGNSE